MECFMYTIELNIDDSILDQCMEFLNTLPKDKLEFTCIKRDLNTLLSEDTGITSPQENKINELLRNNNLSHFIFLRDPDRILAKECGSVRYKDDYEKLIALLNKNNITHTALGTDVVFIEE